jgi:hypothetical protein
MDPPGKFVLVTSFDIPEDDDLSVLVEELMKAIKPLLEHKANHHVWVGIKEHAVEVLNVIGVD